MEYIEVLVKEWEDIRDEIKRRVEQRNYMTEVMAVLVAGILAAVAVAADRNVIGVSALLILGIVPFITAFFTYFIKSSYIRHRYLTTHIRKIEQKINDEIISSSKCGLEKVSFWENWFKEKQNTNRIHAYNAFNIGAFLLCGSIFSIKMLSIIFSVDLLTYDFSYYPAITANSIFIISVFALGTFLIIGVFGIYRSFITSSDLRDIIDISKPNITLEEDEYIENQFSYAEIRTKYPNLVNRRTLGLMILTNKRAFFITKKIYRFKICYFVEKDGRQGSFPSCQEFNKAINERWQVRFSKKCPSCKHRRECNFSEFTAIKELL